MPCKDGREYEDQVAQREQLDKVTRLLCEAMSVIARGGLLSECSEELRAFKRQHALDDAARLVRGVR